MIREGLVQRERATEPGWRPSRHPARRSYPNRYLRASFNRAASARAASLGAASGGSDLNRDVPFNSTEDLVGRSETCGASRGGAGRAARRGAPATGGRRRDETASRRRTAQDVVPWSSSHAADDQRGVAVRRGSIRSRTSTCRRSGEQSPAPAAGAPLPGPAVPTRCDAEPDAGSAPALPRRPPPPHAVTPGPIGMAIRPSSPGRGDRRCRGHSASLRSGGDDVPPASA